MSAAQLLQVIALLAQLIGQPAQLVTELVRAESGLQTRYSELDRDPRPLNVLNGALHLRIAKPRPHHQDDLLTRPAPVEYRPGATHPVWVHYLDAARDADQPAVGRHRAKDDLARKWSESAELQSELVTWATQHRWRVGHG
jgi:hypothetical protein